jgi:hypothetical protein
MTKNDRLILGVLLGGICMFIVMTIISLSGNSQKKKQASSLAFEKTDALKAAPSHHRLIFENDSIRIIELILSPGQETPPHSHLPGIVWVTNNSQVVISDFSSGTTSPVRKDTISLRPDQVNVSREEAAIELHSVKNVGTEEYHEYRVEFK